MANEYGKISPSSLVYGAFDIGSKTNSAVIDTALVMGTSGDAWFVQLNAKKAQSSATLTVYAYVGAVTGSPTFELQVWNGATGAEDDDRPTTSGSNLATSPSSLAITSTDDATWVALTCTVTLVQGQTYFFIVHNTHGTPGSNYATFTYRGALDGLTGIATSTALNNSLRTGYTTDGWSGSDGTIGNGMGLAVVKYGDGTLQGMPYVNSASTSNDNVDKGTRLKFTEDVSIIAFGFAASELVVDSIRIYKSSDGTQVANVSLDRFQTSNSPFSFIEPVTLVGGTEYDIIEDYDAANGNPFSYWMGEAEGSLPTDVLACRPQSFGLVTGATPGSYAIDNSKLLPFAVAIDNNPAISGGSGGLLIHPGMTGGMRG